MGNRVVLGAMLLFAGALCVGVAVISAAWLDTSYAHENTALNQASVQAALAGKVITQWTPHVSIVSPAVIWSAFGLGSCLILAGLVVGVRALPSASLRAT